MFFSFNLDFITFFILLRLIRTFNRLLFKSGFFNYWILGSVQLVLHVGRPLFYLSIIRERREFDKIPQPGLWGVSRNHVNLQDSPTIEQAAEV